MRGRLRFIDLFCGIGGFRLAFEKAGCQCVFSSDWNKYARQTYAVNFGEQPHGDIHSVAVAEIPAHEILCAGFPCQPFSIAGVSKKQSLGRATGFQDKEQGNLFFTLADIINVHQPAAFVLENVKNLRSHDQGRTFQVIHDTLTKALGYTVYYKVIDAQTVVPQHRERIFLVGFKERRGFEFPEFPTSGPKLATILEEAVPEKYTLTDHLWKYLQDYAAKHKAAGNGFGFGLVTGTDTTRTLSARYYKDGSEILISQGPRKNPRRLTPRECARLMGYPEVRFSGFLKGCAVPPSDLMAGRLVGRVLFLGVSADRRVIGFVAGGDSEIAREFLAARLEPTRGVFIEVTLPKIPGNEDSRTRLLTELRRVHGLGWIDSKQLDSDGQLKPCTAPQCGGFTLEAELHIAKNSSGEPDFLGWEVKQFNVEDFERIESAKPITMMTPEPDGGFYKDADVESFIRKFGYADKNDKPDRLNFGGRHIVGQRCPPTGLTMRLVGFDSTTGKITDANGEIALVSDADEVAASWSFKKILEHWAHKHAKAVYVPSKRQTEPKWQYAYGHKVRLAQGTDSLRLLKAFASGAVYYDPGIKLENASTDKAKSKKRSQFRVASRNIGALYEAVETVAV